MVRAVGIALAVFVSVAASSRPAPAQTLIGGGLTALPPERVFGENLLANPGFETVSPTAPGKPASWTTTAALGLDAVTRRSGAYSYHLTSSLNTAFYNHARQAVTVPAGTYRFGGCVKTLSHGDGVSSGARLSWGGRASTIIGGTRDWTCVEVSDVVVAAAGTYEFRVEQYGSPMPTGGQAWYDDVYLQQQTPTPVDAFMLYPNFRGMLVDGESSEIAIDVGVTLPSGTAAEHAVTVTLREEASGAVLRARSYPSPSSRFVARIEAGDMWPGLAYRVEVALLHDATLVYAFPAFRVSRISAARRAGMNVAFDAHNRVLLGGQPRFVLGVYDAGGGYSTSDAYWEDQLWSPTGHRKLDGLAINLYLNYHLGQMPADSTAALLANLQKHGVWYLQTYNCFEDQPASRVAFSAAQDAYVADYGARAGSAGYYTIDECMPTMIPEAFANLQRLRRLDADSVTFAALYPRDDVALFREAADILSTDPYPLFGAEPAGGYPHGNVARDTIRAREAVRNARPFFTVLQFFKFTSNSRWPTLAEMRSHATMAIVEGARGLLWWSVGMGALQNEPEPSRTEQLNKLKQVVGELDAIEPALLAAADPTALAANSSSAVKTLVKVVNGTGYVFAYNSTGTSTTATFTWSTTPRSVAVHGEGRALAVSGSSFTDGFGPYQAHVYVLEAAPTNTAPSAEARTLSIDEDTAVTVTLAGRDAEHCELAFSIVTAPGHGRLGTVQGHACTPGSPHRDTATVVYTPDADWSGVDTFSYRVHDGTLGSAAVSVTVTVRDVTDAAIGTDLVIDNGQPGTTATGRWTVSAAPSPFGANSLYSDGTGPDTYRWTPTIPATGTYAVYVWWTSHANRSASVPYTVVHAGGTFTTTRNQRVGGGQWQYLGTFGFAAGAAGWVEVSDVNGQAGADAVKWVPAGGPIVLDNGQPGASASGRWSVSAAPSPYGSSSLYSDGTGLDTYRWTPTLPAARNYAVYVWWTSHANRSTSVPYTVVHANGTFTTTRNQRLGGGQWQYLGTFAFPAGTTGYVQITDANGQAGADAVQFVPQ